MSKPLRLGLLFLMLLPLTAEAQNMVIEVDVGDNPLIIRGWVGEENSFIGNIGLTLQGAAQGSAPVKLNFYRSDLQQVGGAERILRQHVVIPGGQTLAPGAPTIFQVQVTGVKVPGRYEGRIELLLPDQPRGAAAPIQVVVEAGVRPSLALLTEADRIQANLVNCAGDCRLARLLLPTASFKNELELRFEKPLAAPLSIKDITYTVRGDQTRYSLMDEQLKVSLGDPAELQPDQAKEQCTPTTQPQPAASGLAAATDQTTLTDKKYLRLPVTICAAGIPADHYSGNIYLTVDGQSNALKVPVDFNVRSGPLWPLLILLGSVLLGRLFKYMQDKGGAKADALQAIYRLDFRVREAHQHDAEIISQMLREARDLVYQDRTAEAAAAIAPIPARLATLNELRQIEARLAGKEKDDAVEKILSDIKQAREHIRAKSDEQVKTLVGKIKEALVALAATSFTDSDNSDVEDAVARANVAAAAVADTGAGDQTRGARVRSWLASLSGVSGPFRSEATLWLARPLLWLVLLLGLVTIGIKTHYIDNPIFGANPFTDFFGLMFWGLSADVASRTLSNLRFNDDAARPAGR